MLGKSSRGFAQAQHWIQPRPVKLRVNATEPHQIKFGAAEPFGAIDACQRSPIARNDMTRTELAP